MIKVVLVEDKPLILRNIREKIRNSGQDIEIVGEATDGQSALSLIDGLKPDIVFTDIRMPVLDGLELISRVRSADSDLHFVIISGYNEFDYARQAMKLNVSDYLLKPVKQEEINEILEKILAELSQKKVESTKAMIRNLLNSTGTARVSCENKPDFDSYLSVLFNAGPYSNFIIDYANPFNSYWSLNNPEKVIASGAGKDNRYWIFDGKSFNELIVVLGISGSSDFSLPNFITSLKSLQDPSGIPITIAVSNPFGSIDDIGIETQLLRAFLRKNLVYGRSGVICKDDPGIASINPNPIMDTSLEKRIMTYVQNNQKPLFFKEMEKLFKTWEENGSTQSYLEKTLKYILKLCQKANIRQSDPVTDPDLETDEILASSRDYSALLQGMGFVFEQFFAFPARNTGSDLNKEVMNQVESFLNANYSDPVTINDIAKMVNMHPAYLSRAFKNVKGVSPMEYLTNLRIQKAKELILSGDNLSLKEIAEIAGYSDQFYFSRIFKTVTGKSPSEFKASRS